MLENHLHAHLTMRIINLFMHLHLEFKKNNSEINVFTSLSTRVIQSFEFQLQKGRNNNTENLFELSISTFLNHN